MVNSTQNSSEINLFNSLGDYWWDEKGPLKALHAMNPARLSYILNFLGVGALKGKSLLDVGCGGGILSEPLARLGAEVTGLDASEPAIQAAKTHAETSGLKIDYLHGSIEDHEATYDVITALEILEHVDHPDVFIQNLCRCLKPNGVLFLSTLNRTLKSKVLAIGLGEYVLRWAPIGAHDWHKFMKPHEVEALVSQSGAKLKDLKGLTYHPLKREWVLSSDLDVNYICAVSRI